jgi:hypothetical protein
MSMKNIGTGTAGYTQRSGSSQPTPEWLGPSAAVTVMLGLIAWGTISIPAFLSSLLFAAAAGFVIGWVRQAFSRRSRFGESLISALFGGSLTRDPSGLVFLDLFVRMMAGYAVGLVFAASGIMTLDAGSNWLRALMIGGAGGGPDLVGLTIVAILLLVIAMLIGLLVVLALGSWAGIVLKAYLFDASALAKLAAMGAAKGTIKDAVIAQQEWGNWRIKPGRSAAKGAVTGVFVGMLLIIFGLRP